MKLSWQQFWGLLWTYSQRVPVDQTQKLLKVSRPSIYRWYKLFRLNLPSQDHVRLKGIVQVDEAYFGRQDKKVSLVAAKERGSSKVAIRIIARKSVGREDIIPFLRQHVVPESKLWSDGAAIYRGIAKHWPVEHSYDVHRKGEFGQTSEIEGFFGSLKTFIRRMYHHVTTDYLHEIVFEYQCRLMLPEIFANPASLLANTLPKFSFA